MLRHHSSSSPRSAIDSCPSHVIKAPRPTARSTARSMCTLRTNQLTYERKREELRLSMKMKWVKVNVWELYRSHPMKKRDQLDARIRSDCLLRGLDGLSWGLSPLQREKPRHEYGTGIHLICKPPRPQRSKTTHDHNRGQKASVS